MTYGLNDEFCDAVCAYDGDGSDDAVDDDEAFAILSSLHYSESLF